MIGGVLAVILLAVFLFAPIIPATLYSNNLFGAAIQVNAQVSPSYYLIGCGVVMNPTAQSSALKMTVSYQYWVGSQWHCG